MNDCIFKSVYASVICARNMLCNVIHKILSLINFTFNSSHPQPLFCAAQIKQVNHINSNNSPFFFLMSAFQISNA